MAYLTFQKQGRGRYTSIYATVATWGDVKGGRARGSLQRRLYIGRLADSGSTVRLSKGFAGPAAVDIELEELRGQVNRAEGIAAVSGWLRSLCGGREGAPFPGSAGDGGGAADFGTAAVGQSYVLKAVAEAFGLDGCLIEAFGERTGLALLYLAMHQAVKGEPLYLACHWLGDLWLPETLGKFDFSSPGLSGLMGAVGRNEKARQAFYRAWMARQGHPRALIYDLTSISTYAAALEAAAYGYNRDGEPLPQENLALVCGRDSRLPLFCRLVPGSVPDVVTLGLTARMLRALGLEEFEFALDRGFYSNSNVRDLLGQGHRFTMGVLLSCRQSKDLLAAHRAALNSVKTSIFHEGRSIRHLAGDWTVDMGRDDAGGKLPARTVRAHLFFDPRRRAEGVAALDERIFELESKASAETFADRNEARRWLNENARKFAACLGIFPQPDGGTAVRRRPRAIAARSANAGYQIVICDTVDREPTAVLSDYRSRDRAEKLFDLLKNEDGQYRFRTGRQHVAEGRIFLAFLALVLRTGVENRLRSAGLLKRISVAEFLAEMGAIRAISLPDGTRALREVTKRQRERLRKIGLPPPTL